MQQYIVANGCRETRLVGESCDEGTVHFEATALSQMRMLACRRSKSKSPPRLSLTNRRNLLDSSRYASKKFFWRRICLDG